MKGLELEFKPMVWLKSLHAKLFLVTALVTSLIIVAVAAQITHNSRREMENYSRRLAIDAAQSVEVELLSHSEPFHDPRAIEQMLESMAGPDRSIFQIDVFRRESGEQVSLVTSSGDDDEIKWGPELGSYLKLEGPQAELVELNTGNRAWKVYLPIRNFKPHRPPIGLIRTYCDLERWEDVWAANRRKTFWTLPFVLLGEFLILWVITGIFVKDPLNALMEAMGRLEQGDPSARTVLHRKDELGLIAQRFNAMAAEIQRAWEEREALIREVKTLNAGLQERIDAALEELQAKNQELERLMERIALLREELAQQERLAVAGQLTAAFAHEVGTPLNLVNSHLQLLKSQGDLPPRTRERLGVIHAQIERVGEIVRRLLGLTRRASVHQEPVVLADLLADLQRLWTPTLTARNVAFACQAPASCALFVDRKQMEQLFINLVNNAVDAMPEGGGRITLDVEADPQSPTEAPRWRFALMDDGQGIPAEILDKIFKPMFTTKPEGKGTGLGLAICREIVRAHGGEIHAESPEGGGALFRFTLPSVPRA